MDPMKLRGLVKAPSLASRAAAPLKRAGAWLGKQGRVAKFYAKKYKKTSLGAAAVGAGGVGYGVHRHRKNKKSAA